ncbi:hypothetical protein CRUP_001611 [Coryphaenoides rupestris]|nr:hypothetical protein CRUP_001611 [Coryphaenoides rupestris]
MDDLQPQDLSTCSIPSVLDLTRKGEATSLEAMHMVSPRWYPNSGNGRTGLPLTDAASSDIAVQSGDQIQSDNAFSNTTATLSYPSCEPQNGLGEADYVLSQHYLQHSDGPIDLATRTQLFQAVAQAQEPSVVGEGTAGGELPSEGREYSSSLEDPDSASATYPDQGSVTCPQASRPPSAVNAYSVEDGEASDTDATAQQRLNLEPGEIVFPYTLAEVKVQTPTKSPKKSPSAYKGRATGGGGGISPKKAARPLKRKRKSPPGGHPSSMFSPREPEIKLKYVNYKEERRDPRLDSFSPLVRVHRQPSSSCLYTVINYAEEDTTRQGGLQPGSSGSFLSGAMPSTSCLQPGRVSVHGQNYRSLVCCLCGASANAQGLGDLHGPYYPEGYRTIGKTKASLKTNTEEEGEEEGGDEDDSSDSSDSSVSSCSMQRAGGKQRARPPPGSWPQRGGVHLQQKGVSGSPATKQARMDCSGVLEEGEVVDWYSPPVVAQEPCEYWLHEDCSVWAAGVFLVKGKVYGLEEAVKVAQAMACSSCRKPGATLGCLSKGCPNKYHFRCAVASDCVLVEENFSMKCKKHKNKLLKSPSGKRRDGS